MTTRGDRQAAKKPPQRTRNGTPLRLALLCVFSIAIALGMQSSGGTSESGAQSTPGKGVYVARSEVAPNGSILRLRLQDLDENPFQAIASDLSLPGNIFCGPDGRLYVHERNAKNEKGRYVHRIVRFNSDGSKRTLIAEWDDVPRVPSSIVVAPNGDLYFGTSSPSTKDEPTQGIWRIADAFKADGQLKSPQQILPPTAFQFPVSKSGGYIVAPHAFLSAGPFQGDLLVIDWPKRGHVPGGHVLRVPKPDFNTVVEFIPAHTDPETGEPFHPIGLAVNSQGDVFVTDFTNGKILRYGSDGAEKGLFGKVELANQIAVGPTDLVYVTNSVFKDGIEHGSLFVFDSMGELLKAVDAPPHVRGVTVCQR